MLIIYGRDNGRQRKKDTNDKFAIKSIFFFSFGENRLLDWRLRDGAMFAARKMFCRVIINEKQKEKKRYKRFNMIAESTPVV